MSSGKKLMGVCQICGQYKELTQEHIPPQNAFNSSKVKVLHPDEALKVLTGADDRLPWDSTGLKGNVQQGGYKKCCLCSSCNSNTGQWYMRTYTDFAKSLHNRIVADSISVGNYWTFVAKDIYPLRLYKAMMTMMCDINNNCFDDENLRQFILNKEDNHIDTSKYSLYMFLVSAKMIRIQQLSGILLIQPTRHILVSEMATYPIGFALYLDKPKDYTPFGYNVDDFAKYAYDTKDTITFKGVPYIDINSQLPIDYRTKDEILKCIEDNQKESEDNDE